MTEEPARTVGSSTAAIVSKLAQFASLSRLPHVVIDIAMPCMAALLWLGSFPAAWIVALGVFTVFAGYTAIYALNDLIDRRADRCKMSEDEESHRAYLDAVGGRHPVARGTLTKSEACWWIAGWGVAATAGAFLLRPVCSLIFLSGGILEVLYCVMYRITPARAILSGVIKTLGPIAAIFAVDPAPQPGALVVVLGLVFLWEIGGQNIPADWTDIDEDRKMHARTIPVQLGARWATEVVVVALSAAVGVSGYMFYLFGGRFTAVYAAAALVAGAMLLLYPSLLLLLKQQSVKAQALFNSASYYPLALLFIVTIRAILLP